MRKLAILGLLFAFLLGTAGCSLFHQGGGDGPNADIVKYKQDINLFAKLATTAALDKVKLDDAKLSTMRDFLEAARGVLAVPGQPNFEGARKLALTLLPEGYRFIGVAVVDCLERYVPEYVQNLGGNVEAFQVLIAAGFDGAVKAIDEYRGVVNSPDYAKRWAPTSRPATRTLPKRPQCTTGMCPLAQPKSWSR